MPYFARYFFALGIFLTLTPAWAQDAFVHGRLLDAQTEEPVVFATIRIKGKAIGVISNQDGGFRIPKRFEAEGDSLIISSMGYESRQVSLAQLFQSPLNLILLTPRIIQLEEVLLEEKRKNRRKLSARRIVRNAIKAIGENYPVTPFSAIGYYRDYQFVDGAYLNLNEAILEVFDSGFDTVDDLETNVSLYYKNQNTDFERDTVADNKYGDHTASKKYISNAHLSDYGGNEFTILRIHDAIRNYNINAFDFVNKFEKNLIKNHALRKERDTYTEEEVLYTIRMSKSVPGYQVAGRLYISKRDFAIHKMQYAVYETSGQGAKDPSSEKNRLLFEVVTEYKREDEKMYLNYISFHNDFQLIEPPGFVVDAVVLVFSCECFEVRFNENIDPNTAGDLANYDFSFKGNKIAFNEVVVYPKAVRLFPKVGAKTFNTMVKVVSAHNNDPNRLPSAFRTAIGGVLDEVREQLVNEDKHREIQQFREFFVQKLTIGKTTGSASPTYMDKNRPIFEDQPVSQPEGAADYWINTPLQKVPE
ncbi:carboxypeptidase-like regulatory domain-containing protein [Flavobacteriaceae bacterium 3-367]